MSSLHCYVVIATLTFSQLQVHGQDGVWLSLKGAAIANDGFVDVDDVGRNNENALLCHTDKTDCCGSPNQQGDWYFPDRTRVGSDTDNNVMGRRNYFFRNRGPSVVRLRRRGTTTERGRFYCQIPNANDEMQTIYVNIVDTQSDLVISPSIEEVAGTNTQLQCSIDIDLPDHVVSPPTIEWFFGPNNDSLPSGVVEPVVAHSGNTYTSTLQFSPLLLSHAGTYTCRLRGNERIAASTIILTINREPTVDISYSGTARGGEKYTLLCTLIGNQDPDSTLSYQWTKIDSTAQLAVGNNSNTLSFSPLELSNAGQYICEVTVGSQMYAAVEYITVEIPAPLSVVVTSNKANPIRPIESSITLTCTVQLSQAVDVPVTVNIQITDHTEQLLTTTSPSMDGSTYTTTAMISSFGRSKSGDYTCTSSLRSSAASLIDSRSKSATLQLTLGVYLSLRGSIYTNGSIIFVNNIGESNVSPMAPPESQNGLQCVTDRMPCCSSPNRLGDWFFPNGTVVPEENLSHSKFYSNRGLGNDGTLTLNHVNRQSNTVTGEFCCVLPDTNNIDQTLCAMIDVVNITITPSGVNTAGETYSLECSVNGFEATFQWTDERGVQLISHDYRQISTSSPFSSQLQFSPLHQTHGGNYTCTANVSSTMESQSTVVHVRAPTVTANITGVTPNAGHSYTMLCSVYGAENLNATIEYEWRDQSSTSIGHSNNLTFNSLSLSDAGRYTCKATITSSYLVEQIISTDIYDAVIQIPRPASVNITSDHANSVRPIGSATVTLTCTVELSPSVDIPVTLNILISDPVGLTLSSTSPSLLAGHSRTYVSTAEVKSFGRDQSGWYMCEAKATKPSSQYLSDSEVASGRTQVTVGVYLLLKGTVYANNSIILIDEIGEVSGESSNGFQCVTDNRQCCQAGSQTGAWHLPSGELVPSQGHSTPFYVSRGNGTVVINYDSGSGTTPTSGVFCCEIPNADHVTQTLCSILIPTLTVEVRASGSDFTGSTDFSLTCILSGAENVEATVSYQWIKNNGTRTQLPSNTNRLSFSPLRLSDAGEYYCTAFALTSYLHPINTTSGLFSIQLIVPQPIVTLVSDTPNPILSGSSPILTCAVELDPAVDVAVAVSTVWTGPDGSRLASAFPPTMRSFTHYTSKAKLNYVESADSGTYMCSVSINGETVATVERKVVVGDGLFQLRLITCQSWLKDSNSDGGVELYTYHIEEALIEAIESRCECHFPKKNLFNATLSCSDSPNLTTYRNTLTGTHNFNSTRIIGCIQDWVSTRPWINIKGYAVKIDSSCHVAIASMNEPECGEVSSCPCANDANVAKCVEHLGNEDFAMCIDSCI